MLKPLPLVVDLDGTLIYTDTFHEMILRLLYKRPWTVFLLPFWFLKGRAFTKTRLSQIVKILPSSLPYNVAFLNFAKEEGKAGRPLILATGTPQKLAQDIANHIGIFQEVIGSTEHVNMTGINKQNALLERFGHEGFDYAGDSKQDLHVWKVARRALIVCPKRRVLDQAQAIRKDDSISHFPRTTTPFHALILALRPLFWAINLCAFSLKDSLVLCLFTSGVFIVGDLVTLYSERSHASKTSVFAEGLLPLTTAFFLAPLLTFSSLIVWPELFFYLPFFIAADLLTRSLFPYLRWSLLACLQLIALLFFT